MTTRTDETEIEHWQRYFAARCNNRTWDLMGRNQRTAQETREMLDVAHAAAWHWLKVGESVNQMRADVTLAMAYAWAGRGADALPYARLALDFCECQPREDWDLAFAHLAVAFAAAQAGDAPLHAQHARLAHETGDQIADPDDRDVYRTELARVEQFLGAQA